MPLSSGGVDSLCLTTLYGFNSLELLSSDICRPWDAGRRGLSIGEGASFALLERESSSSQEGPHGWLLGIGESNDGHHMSTPHPEGAGAIAAMQAALAGAGLRPADIDYNQPARHGHAEATTPPKTAQSPPCSARARRAVRPKARPVTTLGAAGGVEAMIGLLALQNGLMPGGLNVQTPDPELRLTTLRANREAPLRVILSNSFGFGGTNASLVLGAA